MILRTREFLDKSWCKSTRDRQILEMEVELLLLVSACWTRSGAGTMTAAARYAGAARCQVVTESRVALNAWTQEEYSENGLLVGTVDSKTVVQTFAD